MLIKIWCVSMACASDSLEVRIAGKYPKGKYYFYIDNICVKEKKFKYNQTFIDYKFYVKIDTCGKRLLNEPEFRIDIVTKKKSQRMVCYVQKLTNYNSVWIYKEFNATNKFFYHIKYFGNYMRLNEEDVEKEDYY